MLESLRDNWNCPSKPIDAEFSDNFEDSLDCMYYICGTIADILLEVANAWEIPIHANYSNESVRE